jgi:hypothetical protein
MVQFCTSFSRPLSSVESLYIFKRGPYYQDRGDIESADQEWLDFLRPFTALKDIYLCETSAQQISYVLLELVKGRVTEVLPSTLKNIFSKEISPSQRIQIGIVFFFVNARELSGHPIAVSCWPDGVVV